MAWYDEPKKKAEAIGEVIKTIDRYLVLLVAVFFAVMYVLKDRQYDQANKARDAEKDKTIKALMETNDANKETIKVQGQSLQIITKLQRDAKERSENKSE